jgi:hypothetical protein
MKEVERIVYDFTAFAEGIYSEVFQRQSGSHRLPVMHGLKDAILRQ